MPSSPLVIVGIGGSGTRVFARLAEASGRHMGAVQNDSSDALSLFTFADRWCEPVYRAWQAGGSPPDQARFETELAASLTEHRQGAPADAPWGWKQPRSIHLLPALDAAYPGRLRVLHVMRDGRDVALGTAIHLQLTWTYSVPKALRDDPLPIPLAHVWASANSLAADFGERNLQKRYLRVTLEELCADPDGVTQRILELTGGDIPAEKVHEIVERPSSIGRWRKADPALVARIVDTAGPALQRFGYTA